MQCNGVLDVICPNRIDPIGWLVENEQIRGVYQRLREAKPLQQRSFKLGLRMVKRQLQFGQSQHRRILL